MRDFCNITPFAGHRRMMLACRFCNGPQSSAASSTQSTTSQQATVGNTGENSSVINLAAGATETGAGGVSAGSGNIVSVSSTNVDAPLVSAFGAELATIAGQSIAAQSITTSNALGFGAEITNNAMVVASAGEQQALVVASNAQDQLSHLGDILGALTANATPQTAAAQSELLAGTTPAGNAVAGKTDWQTYAIVGGFILTALVYFHTKGRPA